MTANSGYTYFIVAPHYRESSLGVQVLHRLCHMINERGGRAWMIGCDVNPEWNAPACTEQAFNSLMDSGEPWIAVYPDVTKGNPLNAPIVVRYMLNREGVIEGNNIDAGDDDLFFWYREEFADKEPNPNIICIENYDLDLFNDNNPVKDLNLLYINRLPHSVIEYEKLPKDIKILSMENPLSHRDLAATLKRARVLYTYECSGTCVLANLCGCPVVSLIAPGFEEYALNEQTFKDIGGAGFSNSDSDEALESVKANLYKVRDHLLLKREIVEKQLDNFVSITQEVARCKHAENIPYSLKTWVNNRVLLKDNTSPVVRLLHVVFCRQASLEEIALTVDSIAPGFDESENILLMVGLPPQVAMDDGQKIFAATEDNWVDIIKVLAKKARFDWLHCIDAGVSYAAEGIALMQHLLLEAGDCRAIYTDEVLKDDAGEIRPCFKPDFNLDLFLSSPQRYFRRFFFHRESWQEMEGFTPSFSSSFEFELLIRFIFRWDLGCIGHISEVTTIVPDMLFSQNHPDEEQHVIEYYLKMRGFHKSWVEAKTHGAWHIHYSSEIAGKVSVLMDAGYDSQRLLRCIYSLLENTNCTELDILISVPYDSSEDFKRVVIKLIEHNKNIRLHFGENGQNVAQRINLLEQQAESDFLLLLSTHTIFIMKNWLNVLMNHMERPEVGCIGPKIISPEKKILSAGIITGADGWLGHIGQGENWLTEGYLSRFQCEQNYSALSGQCLLVKRSAWQAVGGMDTYYENEYAMDVVISLRLKIAGLLCVWTPYSIIASDDPRMLRSNSFSGRNDEMIRMISSKPDIFAEDPTYNRNLSLSLLYYRINDDLTTHWDPLSINKTPAVLIVGDGKERPHTRRLRQLLNKLAEDGQIRLTFAPKAPSHTEFLRSKPAIIILGGDLSKLSVTYLNTLKNSFPCSLLALADDMAENNKFSLDSLPVDLWLTFYAPQQEFLKKNKLKVTLLPAGLSDAWFISPKKEISKTVGSKARILCIPRGWKQKELNFMKDIIVSSNKEIDWVILGEWPTDWIPFVKETWRFKKGDVCPEQLQELNIDAAVIFHSSHDGSRVRDAHLIYQLAACRIPVISSDVSSLVCKIPVTKIKADNKKWLQALENITGRRTQVEVDNFHLSELAKTHYRISSACLKELCEIMVADTKSLIIH